MKFGKYILEHRIPKFQDYYCDYAALKELLKVIKADIAAGRTSAAGNQSVKLHDLQQNQLDKFMEQDPFHTFAFVLEENMSKVDSFAARRFADLKVLVQAALGRVNQGTLLVGTARALSYSVLELEAFGRLNVVAFEKIVKKFDRVCAFTLSTLLRFL